MEQHPDFYTISAVDDVDTTCPQMPLLITAADLLANDIASNGSTLEILELTIDNPATGSTLIDNNDGTWTLIPAFGYTGDVTLTYEVGSDMPALYFGGNGHFYEFVPANQISWIDAKAAAEASTLNGLQGYLATVTSQAENDFITNVLGGFGWIGASDADVEGEWRWVTGPEAGTQFWQGDASGNPVNGMYTNWVFVEPNNQNNEDYGHSSISGFWNDWPNSIQWIQGYVIEYGGFGGCTPTFSTTATVTVTVEDTEGPTFTCPENQDIALSANCELVVPDLLSNITDAVDACGFNVILSQSPVAGTTMPSTSGMTHDVIITATDGTNSTDCTVTLTSTPGACTPEIDVKGNAISIAAGDTTPDVADDTDFGDNNQGAAIVHTFKIFNTGVVDLTLGTISIDNTTDFSVSQAASATVVPGDSTTFTVTYNNTTAGVFNGTVSIANNDLDENPYDFDVTASTCTPPTVGVIDDIVLIVGGSDVMVNISTPATGGTAPYDYNFDLNGPFLGHLFNGSIHDPVANSINVPGVDPANSATWPVASPSNIHPSVTSDFHTFYDLRVRNAEGCWSTDFHKIRVDVVFIDDFITTWETTTANESITIPTVGGGYNYNVNWGDGTYSLGQTGDATHTYATAGTHTVTISGDFPRIYFNNEGDKNKIKSIEQWGDIEWTNMRFSFYGCQNLTYNATDAPDLSGVTDMQGIFWEADGFTGDLSNWDVSNVTTLRYAFAGNPDFNGDITTWDVSNVDNLFGAFWFATGFNQDISGWNTSNVTDFQRTFRFASSFNQDLSGWDMTSAIRVTQMLDASGLDVTNYDNTLIGWAGQAVNSNLSLGSIGLEYCAGETARNTLINTFGWNITGDTKVCPSNQFVTTWETTTAGESLSLIHI